MAQKIQKTNVCRLLDAAGIAYELIEYAVDESDLSATHVAEQLGEDVDAVFKTIVLEGDKVKHFVCVVPGACEVDLKKAARASGNKSCKPIPQKELLPLTGYIRGGCCPIGVFNSELSLIVGSKNVTSSNNALYEAIASFSIFLFKSFSFGYVK